MLQPVGLSLQREASGMVQDTVQHSSRQNRIAHHLRPVSDLLVRRKDDRVRLIGVTDKGEESVGLGSGDRCISDLINDDQLCLPDVPQPEPGSSFGVGSIKDLHEVRHSLKADGIAGINGFQAQPNSEHGLSKPWWAGKDCKSQAVFSDDGKHFFPTMVSSFF